MNFTTRIALVSALSLGALPARADWTGTLHVHTTAADGSAMPPALADQTGLIAGKGAKMRMELTQGTSKMIVVADFKSDSSIVVFDDKHAFMRMANDKMRARATSLGGMQCQSDDEATCLKTNGFSKTGAEVQNGKKSDRWEMDRTDDKGKKVHISLWVPQGVKGFSMIKQTSTGGDHNLSLDVIDFKETSVPEAQFEAPAGYTDVTNHFGPGAAGMGGAQGAGAPPSAPPAGH